MHPPPAIAMPLAAEYASASVKSERAVETPRRGLITAGAWTLGTTHLLTMGYAGLGALGTAGHRSASESAYYAWMFAPVIGPWVSLGYAEGTNATGLTLVSVTSGTLQTLGAGMIVLGVAWKKTEWVSEDARIEIAPMPIASGGGLVFRGNW